AAAPTAAAAPAGIAAGDRRARVLVRGVLLAVPHHPRRGARLEQPGAHVARRAIGLVENAEALVAVGDAGVAPFRFRDLGRLAAERRGERQDPVAERHFVL